MPGEHVAGIEGPQEDHLISFVTTSEVIWIDERFPRKPLLGYEHGREFDKTLAVQTLSFTSSS